VNYWYEIASARLAPSVLIVIGLFPCGLAGVTADWAIDFIDLKLPPALREYCHIVRFPKGWGFQRPADEDEAFFGITYGYADYEFRVEGLLGTRFLVGAFTPYHGRHYDSTNRYRLNLSDPSAPVLPASLQDWNAAAVVPLARKSLFSNFGVHYPEQATFNGFEYKKSGDRWILEKAATRLSPDSSWLVLQSATRIKDHFPWVDYALFFDVFSTVTGRKLFTLQGTYPGIGDSPEGCLDKTAWLTERYFIVPLGRHRERCVVCEFALRREPEGKP